MTTVPIHGERPHLIGRVLERVLLESFVFHGDLVADVNVIFLHLEQAWWRLVLDAGTVHWRREADEPRAWALVEEGWDCPLRDISSELNLASTVVAALETIDEGCDVRVDLHFENGRRLAFMNLDDRTRYEVCDPSFSRTSS